MSRDKMSQATEVRIPAYYREGTWNKFAWLYDPFTKLFFLPFGGEERIRKQFVDFADPGDGEMVLDICSGTGVLTHLIAERVAPGGWAIGVDLSFKMLQIARGRAKSSRVSFQKADAEHLPFPEGIFDKVFISFGLHEMPESARHNALFEVNRTLKSGGSLFIFDYHIPKGVFNRAIIKTFVKLLEEEFAYQMLLDESLILELEQAGLAAERREFICGGMMQMIQARKISKGDDRGRGEGFKNYRHGLR